MTLKENERLGQDLLHDKDKSKTGRLSLFLPSIQKFLCSKKVFEL